MLVNNNPLPVLVYLSFCTLQQGCCNKLQHQHDLDLIGFFEFQVLVDDNPLPVEVHVS